MRREIARLALTKLVQDGRIHPARIEEIVAKSKQEIEQEIKEEGEAAAYEAGVPGLHAEIIKVVGRLKFRTSYGQNQLQHAVEAAHIGAMLASEVGADVNIVRRASFLHDIGKVLTHEVEGPHHIIGADFIRRFGETKPIVQAVQGHHDADPEHQSIEDVLVQAADAASGARPGARRESVENYVRRLEALEEVANSFDGVEKSFAIQAGREVRIIVKPEQVDDLQAMRLARDIVKKIEETLQYPGQVKVTVVRETRAVDYAALTLPTCDLRCTLHTDLRWSTPTGEVVRLAHARGVSTMALTDHDSTDGLAEAQQVGDELGVRVIPGIELSTDLPGVSIHVLGLFLNHTDPDFQQQVHAVPRRARDPCRADGRATRQSWVRRSRWSASSRSRAKAASAGRTSPRRCSRPATCRASKKRSIASSAAMDQPISKAFASSPPRPCG